MWGHIILERIKEPALSSIPPTTKRDQLFDDICDELNKAYGGAIEVGFNIMETHLKVGKIPDPSSHPEAALKALRDHHECMEHASRFIDLSIDKNAEGEIMTGSNLKKMLGFLPLRVRQEDDGFDKAETNATKRKAQYMKIKSWIKKMQEKLLMSGVRIDDTTDNKVTMVAVSKQQQNEPGNTRANNYNNQRYSKPQRQERRGRRETDEPQTTECTYCGLIRDKDVPQECLMMDFKD